MEIQDFSSGTHWRHELEPVPDNMVEGQKAKGDGPSGLSNSMRDLERRPCEAWLDARRATGGSVPIFITFQPEHQGDSCDGKMPSMSSCI